MFFGCAFTAFGPFVAMFWLTISKDAQLVIVLIASAFFWLLSLLLSSILWLVASPLKDELAFGVTFSVLFQELFRLAIFKLLKKADEGLISITGNHSPLRKHKLAYVSGLGFGIMSGLFAMVNILADITGPGDLGLYGDSDNFLIVSAFLTCAFVLLNTFWSIVWFDAWEKRNFINFAVVLFSHWFVALMTLLNKDAHYIGPLMSAYLVMFGMGGLAFHVCGGRVRNIPQIFYRNPISH